MNKIKNISILISLLVSSVLMLLANKSFAANGIKAVWIPDPTHTDMMHSYENIVEGVRILDEAGINMLYVCMHARSQVGFRSEVYTKNSSYQDVSQSYMFEKYMSTYNASQKSLNNDPIKDLIELAHHKGMKVVFWFEYGFMATHGATPEDFPLLAKHPEWQSRGNDGKQANYNGTDYYLNSYHEGLQHFMLDLIKESITLYPKVDGVQGDDRMPAAPRNSGYDSYTVAKYQKQFGQEPPRDFEDRQWVEWRLSILDEFGGKLHKMVKRFDKKMLVCFSPNPYPWCEQKLMQNWPSWLEEGIVDILSVQCYRFSLEHYKSTIDEVLYYVERSGVSKDVFNPGIILRTDKLIPLDLLQQQIEYNREKGITGEAFFWYKAFEDEGVHKTISNLYNQ